MNKRLDMLRCQYNWLLGDRFGWWEMISNPVEYPYLMVREAGEAEGAPGAGGEVFWLGCLIMVNYPDSI